MSANKQAHEGRLSYNDPHCPSHQFPHPFRENLKGVSPSVGMPNAISLPPPELIYDV